MGLLPRAYNISRRAIRSFCTRKPVGTLVHDALLPGKRIWFFATGTGFAPFASLLREPETYENYETVIITHTCRDVAELEFGRRMIEDLKADPLMDELIGAENLAKLRYYPTTTREESPKMGRITTLLQDGTVFADLGIEGISPETDRAMVCGSLGFNMDIKDILEGYGLVEGANSDPQHYVVERPLWADPPDPARLCSFSSKFSQTAGPCESGKELPLVPGICYR